MSSKQPPRPSVAPAVRRAQRRGPEPPRHLREGYEPNATRSPRRRDLVEVGSGEAAASTRKTPPTDAPSQFGQMGSVNPIGGWTVELVGSAGVGLRQGSFGLSGMLAEDMFTNPYIYNAGEQRSHFFTTTPHRIRRSSSTGQRCRDFVEAAWQEMLPLPILLDLHRTFLGNGFSPAVMEWVEFRDGLARWWLPRVKSWQTQLTSYMQVGDPDTVDGGIFTATTASHGLVRITPGDARWVMFQASASKPWLRGIAAVLAEAFLGDGYNFRDNMTHQDRYGRGIIKLFHPKSWKDEEVMQAANSFRAGAGGVFPCPRGPRGEDLVDIDLLKADGAGFMTFDATERRVLRRILIAMLGQDMTTTGQTGGFAQARVHESGLWRKFEQDAAAFGDASLTTTEPEGDDESSARLLRMWEPRDGVIRSQIMRWVALWNFGDAALAPFCYWDATQPEDLLEQSDANAARAKNWGGALAGVATAMEKLELAGYDYDPAYILEQVGLKVRRDEDEESTSRSPRTSKGKAKKRR